jgi:hypothetical protein
MPFRSGGRRVWCSLPALARQAEDNAAFFLLENDRAIRGVTPVFRGVFSTIYHVRGSGFKKGQSREGGENLL